MSAEGSDGGRVMATKGETTSGDGIPGFERVKLWGISNQDTWTFSSLVCGNTTR